MATVRIILDTRRIKKDGTYPIVIRVYHDNKFKDFPTNCQVGLKHWDEKASQVRKSLPTHHQINIRLKELEYEFSGKLMECYREYPDGFTFNDLRAFLIPKIVTRVKIRPFWENEIAVLIQSKQFGNARNYRIALDVLSKTCDLDVSFEQIDYSFLKSIEVKLLERGLRPNSISVYLRALRAIYNMAINKKVVEFSFYPFRAFKIKKEKTVPSVLSLNELQNYFALNLNEEHPLYESWLLGKLSFLLGGINFIDLIQLTRENLKMGRLIYRRSKTKKLYSVLILNQTQDILDYFCKKHSDTICGILNPVDMKDGMRLAYIIRDKNKQFNKRLGQLGILIGSEVKIRSYTFRYSVANVCKALGWRIRAN